MSSQKKTPPKFTTDTPYKTWKNKVEMWQIVTSVEKKQQAIIIFLESLEGNPKAEKAVSDLKATDLNTNEGMNLLFAKLDKVFQSETVDEAYSVYSAFISFQRTDRMDMSEYILEYEHLYQKMIQHDMKLPDAILSFKLLDGAQVTDDERKLALTISNDLSFERMKSALKRLFVSHYHKHEDVQVKQEEAFYNKRYNQYENKNKMHTNNRKSNVKLNPINKHGQVSRCVVCDSKMHWANNCPHNTQSVHVLEDDVEECEEVNIVLLTEDLDKNEIFVVEASKSAVIDTACTKTVAGEQWYQNFKCNLSNEYLEQIESFPSETVFKFGDGRKVKSIQSVVFPVIIADKICKIKTEIVKENIPLLLSKTSLKKAQTVIDLNNDKAVIFGKEINLHQSTSGHYCIDIYPSNNYRHVEEILYLEKDLSNKQRITQVQKIHKQFGHASIENMTKLIKNAGLYDTDLGKIIVNVVSQCESCKRFKKPTPRPVVGLPKATEFNQTVSVDLHYLEPNLWYLHMMDEFSRFSNAVIIRRKDDSMKMFIKHWISIFGAPNCIFSDNGGEFVGSFYDMCEKFNIKVSGTASFSPWSNGGCERHNQLITTMLLKIRDDVKCDYDTALAWAISAKNSLINHNGFSPSQIVFGKGSNLPNIISDSLPALEKETTSSDLAIHIASLHSARVAFMKVQTSEKIKTALKKQTRQTRDKYQIGEEVYYKRDDAQQWKGPGKVLGQDGSVIFLRHGSRFVKAHVCRVQPINFLIPPSSSEKKDINAQNPPNSNNTMFASRPDNDSEDDEENSSEISSAISNQHHDDDISTPPTQSLPSLSPASPLPPTPSPSHDPIKPNSIISFHTNDIDYQAKIISRAGKATGKYKSQYNIEYLSPDNLIGQKSWIDINEIEISSVTNETNHKSELHKTDEILLTNSQTFNNAKEKELKSWEENNVYEVVPYTNQKCISVRWVCSLKENPDGTAKPKARLVARGFEEENLQEIPKDSPTCGKDALRVTLAIIATNKWELRSIDIKTAFLQGNTLSRDVYLKPPAEANCESKFIWKLKKCVYGLSDASLKWYHRVKTFVLSNKGKVSEIDPALFTWHENNSLMGVIVVHVDDFLFAGNEKFQNTIISNLRQTFAIGKEESRQFKYLGLNLCYHDNKISIDQNEYIKNLESINIEQHMKRNINEPLSNDMKDVLRQRIGQLLWLCNQSRPDICFDVSNIASNINNASVKQLIDLNKAINKTKSNQYDILFQPITKQSKIVVYVDAAFGNLHDGGSQSAYLIFLVNPSGKFNLISWQSKRIKRVVRSSLAAETLAMLDGIDSALYIAALLKELIYGRSEITLPVHCITDNKSLCDALASNKYVSDKRLRIDIGALKETIKKNEIECITWVKTNEQLADSLTKFGASSLPLINLLRIGEFDDIVKGYLFNITKGPE